jgi:hypothetical protein
MRGSTFGTYVVSFASVLVELGQSTGARARVLVTVNYVGCFQLLFRVDGGGC